MIDAGAAVIQTEVQVGRKRCGHFLGKVLVSSGELQDRIKDTVANKTDPQFIVIALTDTDGVEGLSAAIERAGQYINAEADIIFAEAQH